MKKTKVAVKEFSRKEEAVRYILRHNANAYRMYDAVPENFDDSRLHDENQE